MQWKTVFAVAPALVAVTVTGCAPKPGPVTRDSPKTVNPTNRATRVPVKHGLDAAAKDIVLAAKDTTIEDILKMERPSGLGDDISSPDFQDQRVGPLETQVWRLKVKVKSIVKRKDGDYFLTIESPGGATTVVEVPDPALCKGSPLEADITASRKDLEERFHPTDKPKDVDKDATVTGVGFWGQNGRPGTKSAPNGARIMPGLGFEWGR
ncbi:MAG: hypothetical protein JST30_05430 [Armatimonadetes bacterium]|nr:hypothetical protein [Armatimonadota bacterium]